MAYGDNFKVYGPYSRPDQRKIVIVVSRNGKRRTVSYPKWLMERHLGRKLHPDRETVDHWDTNIENNDINNLRLVRRDVHSADDTRRVKMIKLNCAWCDKDFERSPRLLRDKAKKKKSGPFCSRSCAGKYSRMLQLKLIKKFKLQKPIKSEYYKRKYVTASVDFGDNFEADIDMLELITFASYEEDDYEDEINTSEPAIWLPHNIITPKSLSDVRKLEDRRDNIMSEMDKIRRMPEFRGYFGMPEAAKPIYIPLYLEFKELSRVIEEFYLNQEPIEE